MAQFPGAVPTTPIRDDANMAATETHKTWHDRQWEELRAIAQTLGTNPQGTSPTVGDRIAAMVPRTGVPSTAPITGALYVGGNPSVGAGALIHPSGQILSTRTATAAIGSPNMIIGRGSNPGAGAPLEPLIAFTRGPTAVVPHETQIGLIRINSGANGIDVIQTSDPRTKQRAGDITDAAARARQLGRAAFRGHLLNADTGDPVGVETDLLSSHDIEDVAPYAIEGERDAVDDNGNPVYQMVNYTALVPLLFAALADVLDRVESIEAAQ